MAVRLGMCNLVVIYEVAVNTHTGYWQWSAADFVVFERASGNTNHTAHMSLP